MAVEVYSCAVGVMQSNCYLAVDSESKKALVVDIGEYCPEVELMLKKCGIKSLEYILLTHGHFDHINGAKSLQNNFGGKIVIHSSDEECFSNSAVSLGSSFGLNAELPEKADITVNDGSELAFGSSVIKVIHTPGHTKGGVCYLFENSLFTGDTLFNGSIGRSDFPGGDYKTLLSSVKKLVSLAGSLKVYPGHGEATTLEEQRRSNPYCSLI